MKNIVYYLVLIVVLGGALISFWGYQRYFKDEEPELLSFIVERGDIQEVIKARGEIVPQKDFDLGFPFAGVVEKVFVNEGEQINDDSPIMKLETVEFELELEQLRAKLGGAKAGTVTGQSEIQNIEESIETTVQKQNTLVASAYRTLLSDDLITKPASDNTTLTPPTITGIYDGPEGRYKIRAKWTDISPLEVEILTFGLETSKTDDVVENKASPLGTRGLFIDFGTNPRDYVNTTWYVEIPNKESSSYASNYNSYQEAVRERDRAIEEAEKEAKDYQAEIDIVQERIRKSTLYSPATTKIAKVWFEEGEFISLGQTAVSLVTSSHKIQADISELEIGGIREVDGNEVLVQLDAFPDLELRGRVVSIEPREVIKEGDKYYRTNIYVESHGPGVRSGMNADLTIYTSSKEDVLKIPEFAVYQKDDKKFVTILEGDKQIEVEIETGISDSDSIEVINGLSEGQTIIVSVD